MWNDCLFKNPNSLQAGRVQFLVTRAFTKMFMKNIHLDRKYKISFYQSHFTHVQTTMIMIHIQFINVAE